jgi:hypothetical protein
MHIKHQNKIIRLYNIYILSVFNKVVVTPPVRSGYVYFVAESGRDRFKVGSSHNPAGRLLQLQTGNSGQLVLLHQRWSADCLPDDKQVHVHLTALGKQLRFGL